MAARLAAHTTAADNLSNAPKDSRDMARAVPAAGANQAHMLADELTGEHSGN
jgi:hypothetical protein